jgi:hypothetical protein
VGTYLLWDWSYGRSRASGNDAFPHSSSNHGSLVRAGGAARRDHAQGSAPPQASGRVRPSAHAPEDYSLTPTTASRATTNLSTPAGEDVSIGAAWRSTIMANAARDPYFYASVRRETVDHPAHSRDIQDECAPAMCR